MNNSELEKYFQRIGDPHVFNKLQNRGPIIYSMCDILRITDNTDSGMCVCWKMTICPYPG